MAIYAVQILSVPIIKEHNPPIISSANSFCSPLTLPEAACNPLEANY